MAHNKKYTLCPYRCPLHEGCARFCESMDKSKTFHFGKNPYEVTKKTNQCNWFIKMGEDDVIDKINELLKIKSN